MEALTEMNLAAELEHIRDADQIAEFKVKGTPALIIDGKEMTVCAGQVVVMPANVPHSVTGVKRFKMLLTVVKIHNL
jgi:quercetin dioxygenase-like cupin family protein